MVPSCSPLARFLSPPSRNSKKCGEAGFDGKEGGAGSRWEYGMHARMERMATQQDGSITRFVSWPPGVIGHLFHLLFSSPATWIAAVLSIGIFSRSVGGFECICTQFPSLLNPDMQQRHPHTMTPISTHLPIQIQVSRLAPDNCATNTLPSHSPRLSSTDRLFVPTATSYPVEFVLPFDHTITSHV